MASFVLLYSGGSMPETQAEQAEVMQAWGAWIGKIGSALVDGGNPFTPIAKTISKGGKVSDGPVGALATGYSVIKADSLDAAVELAKDCPVFLGGGQISVYETYPVM
ncbi:MAG: YciI family protein [Ktedonobacteraceae bacterium]